MSKREAILAKRSRPEEKLHVAAWGEDVWVRGFDGKTRDAFENECRVVVGKKIEARTDNIRARLLVRCLFDGPREDAKSTRIFSDADADALGEENAQVLEPLVEAAQRLCGLSAKDVEELAENLPPAQSAASTSV